MVTKTVSDKTPWSAGLVISINGAVVSGSGGISKIGPSQLRIEKQ